MQLVTRTSQFCVFDNVLSPNDFELLSNYVYDEDYQSVHPQKREKVFSLYEGTPLNSTAVFSHKPIGNDMKEHKVYPTNTGIDIFFECILSRSEMLTEWIGRKSIDWEMFTAKAFLFPQGAGLSWHDDRKNKTGSYIFYTHSSWNTQWGGELLIADETVKNINSLLVETIRLPEGKVVKQNLDNTYENQKNTEVGVGHYIFPKPNRLVVIASGNWHKINKVSSAAGNHFRCSISGFFLSTGVPSR